MLASNLLTAFAAKISLYNPMPYAAAVLPDSFHQQPSVALASSRPSMRSAPLHPTLKAFWPGGLLPWMPLPHGFALSCAPLWCPSFCQVAHGLRFALVRFIFMLGIVHSVASKSSSAHSM